MLAGDLKKILDISNGYGEINWIDSILFLLFNEFDIQV